MLLSYPYSFDCLIFGEFSTREKLLNKPFEQVYKRFWCWYDIKWNWNSSAVFEIRHPQLGPGELPLSVCLLLPRERGKNKLIVFDQVHARRREYSESESDARIQREKEREEKRAFT